MPSEQEVQELARQHAERAVAILQHSENIKSPRTVITEVMVAFARALRAPSAKS